MPPAAKRFKCGEPGCGYAGAQARHLYIHLSMSGHSAEDAIAEPVPENQLPEQPARVSSTQNMADSEAAAGEEGADFTKSPLLTIQQAEQIQPSAVKGQATEDKRLFLLQPVPGCSVKLPEPLDATEAEAEDTTTAEFVDPLPSLGLTAEEATLAEILQKLSVGDQDKLLRLPSLKGAVQWPNSKAYRDHADGRNLQV